LEKFDKEVFEQKGAKFAKVEIASFAAFAIFCEFVFVWFGVLAALGFIRG